MQYEILHKFRTASDERAEPGNEAKEELAMYDVDGLVAVINGCLVLTGLVCVPEDVLWCLQTVT